MYGGFAYRLFTRNGKSILLTSSWSRISDGSGQDHEITTERCKLLMRKNKYKIISWNCKVGFNTKKVEYIEKYLADIYIIQECTKDDIEKIKIKI